MVCATTSLLTCGPLGVRWRAGRPSCHSLVQRTRASPGPDRLGGARTERTLHAHQAARATKPAQSRRNVCRASFLMKLSAAAKRCREEPPEACGDVCHCCLRPRGGKPRTIQCSPRLGLPVGVSWGGWEARVGHAYSRYYENEHSCTPATYT